MHVALRHAQLAVSGEFLNGPRRRPTHCEMRAERVAEQVDPVRHIRPTCSPLYLEKVVPDAVVIDTHSPSFGLAKAPVARLLKTIGRANRPPAIVVLNSSHLRSGAKQLYWQANATFVPLPQQSHRYLAGLVRKLAGFPGCCEPKSFHR